MYKRFSIALFLIASFLIAGARSAEPPFERGAVLIRNELRCAGTGIRAMALAAHPDDEDGATLSFLRMNGVETHTCFCTRGEGGQNEAGPELGVQLAVMRTHEIEAACAILGAKPWFLNLPDFGFSKSVEETMGVWKHDVALERLVRVIRTVRPHIVITNHNPDGTDHGHHRTAGKLLVEAFDAAADETKFRKQISEDQLKPWAITRIYLRHFSAEGSVLTVDVSKRDGLSGLSASEIGAYALSRHASQGMLRNLKAGERELRHFSVLKSRTASAATQLESVSTDDAGPTECNAIADALDCKSIVDGSIARRIIALMAIPNPSEHVRIHLSLALIEALGLQCEVKCADEFITPGESAKISVRVANTGPLPVKLIKVSVHAQTANWSMRELRPEKEIGSGGAENMELEASADKLAHLTYPVDEHIFDDIKLSENLMTRVWLNVSNSAGQETSLPMSAPVPLDLAPPYTFSLAPPTLLIFGDPGVAKDSQERVHVELLARCNMRVKEPVYLAGAFAEKPTEGDIKSGKVLPFSEKGETAVWTFNRLVDVEKLNAGATLPTFVWDGKGYYATPAQEIRRAPLEMPANMRVALIKGVDDQTFNALKSFQNSSVGAGTFSVVTPSDDDLRTMDLNKFQAVVLDIRATQQRPEIRKMKDRLLAFMNAGGTVVCMYQKDFDWNENGTARGTGFFRGVGGGGMIAPYPIELSFERVTHEEAPVRILNAEHPLLVRPCKIWPKDFDGWVQERGAYFPKKWAPEYTPLLSSNDPGEKPLDGGLLVADVGRGAFIYTSYFWHRQLRAGVPGAFRMLANMLCYSRMKRE